MTDSDRTAAERFFAAWEGWDLDTIGSLLADDPEDRRPRSAERFAGRSNIFSVYTNLVRPAIAWVTIRGAFPIWVAEGTVNYGQGPVCLIGIVEAREGKIQQADFYFAYPFDLAGGRAQ